MIITSIDLPSWRDSLEPLLENYWSEADERRETHGMGIDFDTYIKLQDAGMLEVLGAIDDEENLLGFIAGVYSTCLHTGKEKLVVEITYVSPEHRNKNIAEDLIKQIEEEAKLNKVDHVFFTLKTEAPHNNLVKSLAYIHVENVYMKVLV